MCTNVAGRLWLNNIHLYRWIACLCSIYSEVVFVCFSQAICPPWLRSPLIHFFFYPEDEHDLQNSYLLCSPPPQPIYRGGKSRSCNFRLGALGWSGSCSIIQIILTPFLWAGLYNILLILLPRLDRCSTFGSCTSNCIKSQLLWTWWAMPVQYVRLDRPLALSSRALSQRKKGS